MGETCDGYQEGTSWEEYMASYVSDESLGFTPATNTTLSVN